MDGSVADRDLPRFGDILFYVGYSLWLASSVIALTTFFGNYLSTAYWRVICWICFGILLVSEIVDLRAGVSWSWRSFAGLLIFAILIVCCVRAGRTAVMYSLPFLFCARNRDLRVIFKVSTVVLSLCLFVVVLAAYQGLINNAVEQSGTRLRHYLGFRYPLRPSMIAFSITGMMLYLAEGKLDVYLASLLLVANALMYSLTGSRLSFILAVSAIVACLIVSAVIRVRSSDGAKKRKGRAVSACIVASCFFVMAMLAISLSVLYDPGISWMAQLNAVLGERLRLMHDAFGRYGVTAFGQKVGLTGGSLSLDGQHSAGPYLFIDSAYVQLLVVYGVVFLLVYLTAMSASCFQRHMRRDVVAVVLLVTLSLHGAIDTLSLNLWLDPLLFFVSGLMAEPPSQRGNYASAHAGR